MKLPTIELIPGREIPPNQVEEIKEMFLSEGVPITISSSVYIRKGMEILSPILIFTFGALAGGFLGAIGQDAWKAFKRALQKAIGLLTKHWRQTPRIMLRFEENGERIIVNLPTESDALMRESLDKLPAYLDKRPKGPAWIVFDRDSHEWKE